MPDFEKYTNIDDLKKVVELNNYSAITVSSEGSKLKFAAIKSFDHQLTIEECQPSPIPCKLYIFKRPAG